VGGCPFVVRDQRLSMKSSRKLKVLVAVMAVGGTRVAQAQQDTTVRRQQRQLDSLAAAMQAVQARLDSLERAATAGAQPAAPARAAGAYMNIGFDGLVDGGTSNYAIVREIEKGDHDPKVRGFTIPNAEVTLDANVDPYFKGFANLVWKLDAQGETDVELEEAYAITTSLPKNLQAKVGQFFTEFGRQNPQHPHTWAFVDAPLVLTQMFGPEGLRSQGLRVSWLAPTSFYTEAMVTVANSAGGTTFSFRSDDSPAISGGVPFVREVTSFSDMLIAPRLTTSFDLTDTQTLVAGISGAFGPNNAGTDTRTSIYGADLYWKWKSLTAAQGFPFWSFQAEGMLRRYGTDARIAVAPPPTTLPAETLRDGGGYAQVLWGIKPRVVAGLRGDYVNGDSATFDAEFRGEHTRISPNFTWYPTEFSKLRVQYNYDHRPGFKDGNSIWFQFEYIMGAHAAHKF
jgi:hypothetical protein